MHVGEVSLRYSNRNGYESAAVLVCRSNANSEDVLKSNTYANVNDVAPGLHEMPIFMNQSQYETVVEHRTVGPAAGNPNAMLPLYEGVGYEGSSATSSLFYQYVPTKVRNLLKVYWIAVIQVHLLCHQL